MLQSCFFIRPWRGFPIRFIDIYIFDDATRYLFADKSVLGDIVDSYNCQDKVCHMTSFESGNSQSIKALCCRNMARNKLRGFVKKYWDEFVLWLYQDPVVRLAGNIWISITISLSLFPGIQLMIVQHWFRQWLGTDQVFLSEPMMVSLLMMHICVTRLQWINRLV